VDAGDRIAAFDLNELLHLSRPGTFALIFGHGVTVSRDMLCEGERWTQAFMEPTVRTCTTVHRAFVLDDNESITKMSLDLMHYTAQNERNAEESDADFEEVWFTLHALIFSHLNDIGRPGNCGTLID
jgi:hypothetical protein